MTKRLQSSEGMVCAAAHIGNIRYRKGAATGAAPAKGFDETKIGLLSQQPIELVFDHSIALAGTIFQFLAV